MGLIARQSGVADAQTLMAMGEAFQFDGVALSVPYWLVYLLTRLADFALSIAVVLMIGVTAGHVGLRQLWAQLTRWRMSWVWRRELWCGETADPENKRASPTRCS